MILSIGFETGGYSCNQTILAMILSELSFTFGARGARAGRHAYPCGLRREGSSLLDQGNSLTASHYRQGAIRAVV